jgi:hypothetical protein
MNLIATVSQLARLGILSHPLTSTDPEIAQNGLRITSILLPLH